VPNFIRNTTPKHMLADVTELQLHLNLSHNYDQKFPLSNPRDLLSRDPCRHHAHPHCLSKRIFVRGFHTKIWRSSTNRNLINIRRTRETVLAAPRAQCVSSSLLRLDLAPTTAVPRAEAHAEWARCIVRMLITCKWGTRIRVTGA